MGSRYLMKKRKKQKGEMARKIVYFCISIMTFTLIWAMVLKTIALFNGQMLLDVSDVLTFTGAAFGGELLLLACKRIFAKPSKEGENYENDFTEIDQ